MQSSRRICHNPFYEIVDRSEEVFSSPPWLLHLRGVSYSLVHGLCTCCAVYSIVNVLMKEENLSFLLTLTKKAKNRRIKWNFIKNILQAALIHGGYCLGHGLGLHLLLRQFHFPDFQTAAFSSPPSISACSSSRVFSLGFVMGGRSFLLMGKRKEQPFSCGKIAALGWCILLLSGRYLPDKLEVGL